MSLVVFLTEVIVDILLFWVLNEKPLTRDMALMGDSSFPPAFS